MSGASRRVAIDVWRFLSNKNKGKRKSLLKETARPENPAFHVELSRALWEKRKAEEAQKKPKPR